jgi:hypothetical protein
MEYIVLLASSSVFLDAWLHRFTRLHFFALVLVGGLMLAGEWPALAVFWLLALVVALVR